MKKLSFIFDKKVRLVAFLLSLTLIFDVFYYDYKQAHAVGETAVAAAASTAIPVVGPFIAVTLVACGVVGAIEWCRNHPEEVESVRKDLVKALNDAGEDYASGVKTNSAAKEAGGEWIKTNIVDGKNYISSKILDTCLDVYSEHGLLDGVKTDIVNQDPIPVGNTFNVSTYDVYTYLDSLTFRSDIVKEINSAVIKAIDELGTPDVLVNLWLGTSSGFHGLNVDVFRKSDLAHCTVSNSETRDFDIYGNGNTPFKFIQYTIKNSIDTAITYIHCHINIGNGHNADNVSSVNDTKSLKSSSSYYYIRDGIFSEISYVNGLSHKEEDYVVNSCSNIGSIINSGIETSDKVARKNPTTGAWELPWDTGANVNVQGVGDSYPVSIPWENSFVWNPSQVDYPDIALPFPGELDIPYPDLPITGSQEKIQTGEIELPEPIPNEPDIQENEQSYFLPQWIEDRFPFCIPKDLSTLASLFSNTSRQPPEWVAKLTYGDNKEYSIPINFNYKSADGSASFDRIAYICRLIQFILFLAGLMILTRNLLRS